MSTKHRILSGAAIGAALGVALGLALGTRDQMAASAFMTFHLAIANAGVWAMMTLLVLGPEGDGVKPRREPEAIEEPELHLLGRRLVHP